MTKTRCDVYSRIVGYLRPINQWNEGKKAEWDDRKEFNITTKEDKDMTEEYGQKDGKITF
jgi:ribonucleoside-triphosphate reductase